MMLRYAHDLGSAPDSLRVSVVLLLRDPVKRQPEADVAAIYDPRSPQFGRYKSVSQVETLYGPRPAAVAGIRRVLARHGLTVHWHPGDAWMLVDGPAARADQTFGIRIHRYRLGSGKEFWASSANPIIPTALRSTVVGAAHVTSYLDRRDTLVPPDGLTPVDMVQAYDVQPLRSQGFTGKGETIAFIEIDGYRQQDFDAFTKKFGLPAMHPILRYGSAIGHVDGEAELDMQVVHEIAPAAKLTVYNCSGTCSNSDFIRTEAQAVRGTPGGIISVSIGGCESAEGADLARAEATNFDRADALGESVFVASGDSGAFECLSQNWNAAPTAQYVGVSSPASVPGVTAVGGTRLSLTSQGQWYREQAWEVAPQTAGTGGGISGVFLQPSWQRAPGVQNSLNSGHMRELPDVAADADVLTSAQVNVNGQFNQVGGTSQATPIWAGITALINQYLKQRGGHGVGFFNPALYSLARSHQPYPPFHDITLGGNLFYPATVGYDLATGLGTPDSWNLARDLNAYQRGGGR